MDENLERLPHREPFRFLSELLVLEPGIRGRGVWRVTGREAFFRGHFPGNPIVPGVLIAEALAQLSGIVAAASRAAGSATGARLARVEVKFAAAVKPPAEIVLESKMVRELGELRMFEARAEVEGKSVAEGSLVLVVV